MCGKKDESPYYMVNMLGWKVDVSASEDINGAAYIKTQIKYDEFMKKIHEYVSEEVFSQKINSVDYASGVECFKNVDGFLYVLDGGSSGTRYELESVEKKENNTYIAKYYIISGEISEDGVQIFNEKKGDVQTIEFTVAENNGKCIINSIVSE